jgi:DNA anti-recombination protein RmuC
LYLEQGIRFLSALFADPLVIAVVCAVLVLSAVAVGLNSTTITNRVKRDARTAVGAIRSAGNAVFDSIAALPTDPISDRVKRETSDTEVLNGIRYRIPSGRTSDRLQNLIYSYADIQSLDAWPNIFVGIGLLLTFLGLALSLWNASRGAANGDISVVKQSVTTLLEFSAVKFTTSLVALLCSIVLSIVLRAQRHSAYKALEGVEVSLDALYPPLTSERLTLFQISQPYRSQSYTDNADAIVEALFRSPQAQLSQQHLEEILEQAREQTAQLQSFNSNLAIQLGEALDSKLQPLMQHAIDRLEAALRDMGGTIGSSNQDALRSLLASFIDELRSTIKTDSTDLQRNLGELAASLGQASSQLTDRMGSVFASVEATGEKFASILSDASLSFRDEIGRAQENVGSGLGDALTAIKASAEQSARQTEVMLGQLTAGAASFRSSVEGGASTFVGELDRGAKSIDVTVANLSGAVSQLGSIVDRVSNFGEASARVSGERLSQLNSTLSDLDAGFKRVQDASTPFARAAEQVRASIELLRVTEASIQSRLGDFSVAASAMSRSSDALSTSFGRDVSRLTDGLGNASDQLTTAISAIARESTEVGSAMSEALRQTLAEYQKRFAAIDRDLQTGLTTIVETFAKTYEEIRQRVGEVDSQMAQSVGRLASFNDQFGEHAETFAESVEKLSATVGSRR